MGRTRRIGANSRAGGREARRSRRQAPLEHHLRPVWPGMKSPGIGPLDEAAKHRIHKAILRVLDEVGFGEVPPFGVDTLTGCGAVFHSDTGRVTFPPALVEDMIASASSEFTWAARDPRHDLHLGGDRLYFGTGGAAVHAVDIESRSYRESTLLDLYNAARVADLCENIHFFQRTMVARDMSTPLDLDINTAYVCLAGTLKHVGMSFNDGKTYGKCLELLHLIAGGEAAWRKRPFVSNANCFVVPPLKFAHDSCEVIECAARTGTPILALSAGQAGATAPAAIAGAVVQAFAESLVGMIYVNAISPGHPVVLGSWPFVSDLRTGAMSGGSPEQSLLTSACGQMGRYYGLPTASAAGMADAKLPDAQAGYEKGLTLGMAGLSGLNLVYESAGMQASLLGFSLDAMILDNDILGASLRCARGMTVDDSTCSVDVIREVCTEGPGHYLGSSQTLELMQRDYFYPDFGDRSSPKEWNEFGRPDLLEAAARRREEILTAHFPEYIPSALDAQIRERFAIRIPRTAMSLESAASEPDEGAILQSS